MYSLLHFQVIQYQYLPFKHNCSRFALNHGLEKLLINMLQFITYDNEFLELGNAVVDKSLLTQWLLTVSTAFNGKNLDIRLFAQKVLVPSQMQHLRLGNFLNEGLLNK